MNNTINKMKRLLLVCIVLVAVSVVSILLFVLYQHLHQPFDSLPIGDPLEPSAVFSILSAEEKGEDLVVTTNLGAFRYPAEYADTIHVEAGLDGDVPTLRFTITVDAGETTLFTICYGGKQGIPCGTYRASADVEEIPVYVIFADVPNQLESEDRVAFEGAQELFNDIVLSMEEDPRFIGLR